MFSRPQPCVLIVDDDDELRAVISEHLSKEGFAVAQAPTGADAQDRLKGFAYDGLVIDLKLPDANGLEILDAALTRYPEMVAVVMTGYGGVEEAVAAIKRGAIDFLHQAGATAPSLARAGSGGQRAAAPQENAELRAQLRDRYRFDNVIGQSTTMQTVFQSLELVAPMNSTVLIQGETGTGKELIARTIHHNSPRADQRSSPSTRPPFPSRSPRRSCSATRRARSRARSRAASAASSWPIAARSSSTKWR
jgi:DNA-binding NtrC family response regulator